MVAELPGWRVEASDRWLAAWRSGELAQCPLRSPLALRIADDNLLQPLSKSQQPSAAQFEAAVMGAALEETGPRLKALALASSYGAQALRAGNVGEAARAQVLVHWLQSLWGDVEDVFVKV